MSVQVITDICELLECRGANHITNDYPIGCQCDDPVHLGMSDE